MFHVRNLMHMLFFIFFTNILHNLTLNLSSLFLIAHCKILFIIETSKEKFHTHVSKNLSNKIFTEQ